MAGQGLAGQDSSDDGRPGRKRSQTVSLVLVAGAGLAALALGRVDESQREEDVLVYAGPSDCITDRIRDALSCQSEYETARKLYPDLAPRYSTVLDCETHHGTGHCLAGANVTAEAAGKSVPRMAGYLIGRRVEQGVQPQPVFEHAPQRASQSGHGGYCTGSGTRIVTGSGGRSSAARVASSGIRRASFGGFGTTGHAFSSGARSFFSGG